MGDEKEVQDLIVKLKQCSEVSDKQEVLSSLRNRVIKSVSLASYFHGNGSLRELMTLMQNENRDVRNLAVSLLGYCCLQQQNVDELSGFPLVLNVLSVMHAYAEDTDYDEIACRCWRLLGNIIKHWKEVSDTDVKEITQSLAACFRSRPEVGTQLMALRCLYLLWRKVTDSQRDLMVEFHIICSLWLYMKSTDALILEKASSVFFLMACFKGKRVIEHVYRELPVLIESVPHSGVARRLLLAFSYCEDTRLDLVRNDAVETLIKCLSASDLSDIKDASLAISLCWLCAEPLARARIFDAPEGMSTVLKLISGSKRYVYKKSALVMLVMMKDFSSAMSSLIYNNLLLALIDFFKTVIMPRVFTVDCSVGSVGGGTHTNTLPNCAASIDNDNEAAALERANIYFAPELTDPFPSPAKQKGNCLPRQERKGLLPPSENLFPTLAILRLPKYETREFDSTLAADFIKRLVCLKPPVKKFSSKEVWGFLIECVLFDVKRNVFASVLRYIAEQPEFFCALLSSQFPLQVHRRLCRPDHSCSQIISQADDILSHFANVALSTYGKGVLKDEICKKDTQAKLISALTIAHVFKSAADTLEFMERHHLLDILTENMMNNNMMEDSVSGLNALALAVNICDPLPDSERPCCKKEHSHDLRGPSKGKISFVFDDGRKVSFDKGFIASVSQVFYAMIYGGFKETYESVVKLESVSSECFEALMNTLKYKCDCFIKKLSVPHRLEIISITDRFLIEGPCVSFIDIVTTELLSKEHLLALLEWYFDVGKHLKVKDIAEDIILKYLLVGMFTHEERVEVFKDIVQSHYAKQFLNIMKLFLIEKYVDAAAKNKIERGSSKCVSRERELQIPRIG